MYTMPMPQMGPKQWMDGKAMVIELPSEKDIARQGAYLEGLVPKRRPEPEDMPAD